MVVLKITAVAVSIFMLAVMVTVAVTAMWVKNTHGRRDDELYG